MLAKIAKRLPHHYMEARRWLTTQMEAARRWLSMEEAQSQERKRECCVVEDEE